jgi:DNA-binding transcriptional ArsR family regulator
MVKSPIRKRLIDPKIRLLLWIHLHGIKDENTWRAKTSKILDYSKGSVDSELNDLLDKGLVESLNQDGISPPYRLTNAGKSFLGPILYTQRIGMFTGIWVSLWAAVFYALFYNQPLLMVVFWLPLLITSFIIMAVILIFYPYLLVYGGRRSYRPKSSEF